MDFAAEVAASLARVDLESYPSGCEPLYRGPAHQPQLSAGGFWDPPHKELERSGGNEGNMRDCKINVNM